MFLGFTSNLISSGVRDIIRYLVEHHMVSRTMASVILHCYIQYGLCFYLVNFLILDVKKAFYFNFFPNFLLLIWMQVDVVVTTTGGIEEDLIKCLAPTYKGDFSFPGAQLRSKGLNRIGNLLVPNDNYCKFEDWIIPIFDQMLKEQIEEV